MTAIAVPKKTKKLEEKSKKRYDFSDSSSNESSIIDFLKPIKVSGVRRGGSSRKKLYCFKYSHFHMLG